MIKFYAMLVRQGKIDIDDIPFKWRDAVREELS